MTDQVKQISDQLIQQFLDDFQRDYEQNENTYSALMAAIFCHKSSIPFPDWLSHAFVKISTILLSETEDGVEYPRWVCKKLGIDGRKNKNLPIQFEKEYMECLILEMIHKGLNRKTIMEKLETMGPHFYNQRTWDDIYSSAKKQHNKLISSILTGDTAEGQ